MRRMHLRLCPNACVSLSLSCVLCDRSARAVKRAENRCTSGCIRSTSGALLRGPFTGAVGSSATRNSRTGITWPSVRWTRPSQRLATGMCSSGRSSRPIWSSTTCRPRCWDAVFSPFACRMVEALRSGVEASGSSHVPPLARIGSGLVQTPPPLCAWLPLALLTSALRPSRRAGGLRGFQKGWSVAADVQCFAFLVCAEFFARGRLCLSGAGTAEWLDQSVMCWSQCRSVAANCPCQCKALGQETQQTSLLNSDKEDCYCRCLPACFVPPSVNLQAFKKIKTPQTLGVMPSQIWHSPQPTAVQVFLYSISAGGEQTGGRDWVEGPQPSPLSAFDVEPYVEPEDIVCATTGGRRAEFKSYDTPLAVVHVAA